MTLTRDYKETILKRTEQDPEFAQALLDEAVTLFLNGDSTTSRVILRDLVNATLGFEELALKTKKTSKSLHRMLSSNGNPTMDNLSRVFSALKDVLKVDITVQVARAL